MYGFAFVSYVQARRIESCDYFPFNSLASFSLWRLQTFWAFCCFG